MFTGIIQTVGTIEIISSRGNYKLLTIKPASRFEKLELGESISVDGCCLTVTQFDKNDFTVEASQESVRTTIINKYSVGRKVNLERALLPSDRLGGHIVAGHVDCIGEISDLKKIGESVELSITYPDQFASLVVSKGSIAINGISLTINEIKDDNFATNIIPHTQHVTTIENMKRRDNVNLEFDIIGKYVARLAEIKATGRLTIDKLINSGWNNTGWSNND